MGWRALLGLALPAWMVLLVGFEWPGGQFAPDLVFLTVPASVRPLVHLPGGVGL